MSQQKGEKKRARAPNFSPGEKVALLNLIKTYSHIIENKKTDAVTWQDKSKARGEIIRVKKETRVRCGDNGSPIGIIIRKN
jgi:hypothetical protein